MLPKRHRLTRAQDFGRVRRYGRSFHGPLLVLFIAPGRGDSVRVGFSVNKRVGRAVVRNLVKRRLREAVRTHLPRLRPGYDLLVIARPAAATAPYAQLENAISQLIAKAEVSVQLVRSAGNA